MRIFKNHFLILILIAGFLTRIFLSPIQGFKFDVGTWFAWAERLNSVGFAHFYSNDIWTGYPPGFLYILSFLGFIKNLFQIDTFFFYSILKFPSILAEIILAFLIYQIIPKNFGIWRKLGLLLVVFNPAFIFNSAIFGQFDGLFSLSLLLSIYFLVKKKVKSSCVFWGISFLLKPQAIILAPVFLFYIFKNFSIKIIAKISLSLTLTILIAFLPFFPTNPINGPIHLVVNLLDFYPYNSIFAYNLWGILGFWIKDNNAYLSITYQNWGYILFAFFWIIIGFTHIWKKRNFSLFTLSTLSSLSFFFLITRMHERYLYPGLVFLIIVAVLNKSRLLVMLTIILSLIHFLDLYYVYIYYNQFYLNHPSDLYNSFIYNFANKNIPLICLLSTIIFVLISITIIKSYGYFQKD